MKNNFICPKCFGHLLVGDKIILTTSTKKDKRLWLVLLSPKLGDYTNVYHSDFQLSKGESADFFCPLCHTNLAAPDTTESLVSIIMVDEFGEKHEIVFSGVEGEHCTYKISEKSFEAFGNPSEVYEQYFKTRRI